MRSWEEVSKAIDEYFNGPCDSKCSECPFNVECATALPASEIKNELEY